LWFHMSTAMTFMMARAFSMQGAIFVVVCIYGRSVVSNARPGGSEQLIVDKETAPLVTIYRDSALSLTAQQLGRLTTHAIPQGTLWLQAKRLPLSSRVHGESQSTRHIRKAFSPCVWNKNGAAAAAGCALRVMLFRARRGKAACVMFKSRATTWLG
jgi:hypothetical protein